VSSQRNTEEEAVIKQYCKQAKNRNEQINLKLITSSLTAVMLPK